MNKIILTLFLILAIICIADAWGSRSRRSTSRSTSRSRSYSRRSFSRSRYSSRSRYGRRSSVSRSRYSRYSRSRYSPSRRYSSSRRFTSSRRSISQNRSPKKSTRTSAFGRFVSSLRSKFSRKSPKAPVERTRSKEVTVYRGPLGSIRKRDETGHRTGLGTIARSFFNNPKKTLEAFGAFGKNYKEMRAKNLKGGNLAAHEKANYEATKVGGDKLAGAISGLREQYKRFRIKSNPDGSKHYGDTRTRKEIKDTMDANKAGRERAKSEDSN